MNITNNFLFVYFETRLGEFVSTRYCKIMCEIIVRLWMDTTNN